MELIVYRPIVLFFSVKKSMKSKLLQVSTENIILTEYFQYELSAGGILLIILLRLIIMIVIIIIMILIITKSL